MWLCLVNANDVRSWPQGKCAIVLDTNGFIAETDLRAALDTAKAIVCNQSLTQHLHPADAGLTELRNRAPQTWVHLGNVNSDGPLVTREYLSARWKEYEPRYGKRLWNPFSMSSNTKWDRRVKAF